MTSRHFLRCHTEISWRRHRQTHGKEWQSLGTQRLTETPHSPACTAPGKWDVTCCQQLCANKIVHMAAVGGMGLKRDKFLSLTIANGLQADWQLQSTQFPALVQMTRHLWDCMGEERRQNKSVSIYFYTADPSAPLHSWQGLELCLDPSQQKPLYEAWESPTTINTIWIGLPRQRLFWAPQVASPSC